MIVDQSFIRQQQKSNTTKEGVSGEFTENVRICVDSE